MKLRKLFLVGLVFAFLAPSSAFSESVKKPYFSASGGILWAEDSSLSSQDATLNAITRGSGAKLTFDTGTTFSLAAGAQIIPQVRGEVEYSFKNVDGDKITSTIGTAVVSGDVDVNSLMFNAYYDFDTSSKLKPYLGGGIGVAWINVEGTGLGVTVDDTTSEFAYQIMTGLGYEYNSNVTLNTGYRYFGANEAAFPLLTGTVDSHSLEFGIRYSF